MAHYSIRFVMKKKKNTVQHYRLAALDCLIFFTIQSVSHIANCGQFYSSAQAHVDFAVCI